MADLLRPLGQQLDRPNIVEATRFIAGGKLAAVKGPKSRCEQARDRLAQTRVPDIRDAGRKADRIAEHCDTVLVAGVPVCFASERPPSGPRYCLGQAIVSLVTHFQRLELEEFGLGFLLRGLSLLDLT
jgi:hypothetical protein